MSAWWDIIRNTVELYSSVSSSFFFLGGGVGGSGYTSIHLASESVLIQMIAIQSCSGGSGVSILPIPTHLTRLELAWNWS